MSKQLTGNEAARIATEVNHWVEKTHYQPTPEDTTIMKAVAAGVVKVTLYKTILGAAAGSLLGVSLPRMFKSIKLPLSVMTSVGVLAGVVSDVANRQRESMSNWLKLQRNVNTPLTDKIYRTAVEIAPLSDEGKIARAWLDSQAGLPPPSEFTMSDASAPPAPTPAPNHFTPSTTIPPMAPVIPQNPRRPGSGFYDVRGPVMRNVPTSDPHKPGTGFYDVTRSGSVAPHLHERSSDEEYPIDLPKPSPVVRPLISRAPRREPKMKADVNRYGDEVTTAV
eukprot:Phypoly_transcript_10802.p1 GENE.Phypoly_transcript_10802~~Phypoly_transcript_10802.p1  ORF type:complete len:279 (+),score=38.88 Phypoly_transcript_10802:279-1115(+)